MSDNITSVTDLLTADLSDPKLTQFPILAGGTYDFLIDGAPKVVTEEGTRSLRYSLKLIGVGKQHNTDEPWNNSLPITVYQGLTPSPAADGRKEVTLDMVKRNVATFVQACGERVFTTPEQAAAIQSNQKEVLLPQFAGKKVAGTVKVSVNKKSGETVNNVNLQVPKP